jgi:hypothetical protein
MSIDTLIRDGVGGRFTAQVNSDNALKVYQSELSLADESEAGYVSLTRKKQYRDWLRTNGGSYEMNVNGSVTPVLFEETSQADRVKWIVSWRFILNGTYLELSTNDFRRFGAAAIAPGLTNGLQFYFVQGGRQIDVFLENVKKIGDFMDYADDYTNLINAVSAQSDYLAFDFVFDQPVALPAGSHDKIVMKVSDDLTAMELMRVVVRGWQEFI